MKAKKIIAVLLAAVMLVCTSVAMTIAYLTDSESVTNTFTVGKVSISLDETKVDEYGVPQKNTAGENEEPVWAPAEDRDEAARVKENNYKLIPGKTYVKDPAVTVDAGSEDSYIRMLVTISDLADVKDVFGVDAVTGKFLPQNFVTGWDPEVWITTGIITEDTQANTAVYEFRYKETVKNDSDKGLTLDPLFDSFTVPGEITGEQLKKLYDGENPFKITVEAHAIQAAGFADAKAAWEAFDEQKASQR